jgi:N-acetylglucosamine kinase-like BadF-type ATPase
MIVIADSGSTKCSWQFVATDGTARQVCSDGINAVLHTAEQIEQILKRQLPAPEQVQEVWFYGAGCGRTFPKQSALLRQLLVSHFGCEQVEVESDLTGAARALLGSRPGIACILGTGMNSCYWNGREVAQNVPPLGWILGDEGGGSYIGRHFVANLLKGLYGEPLRKMFFEEEQTDYGEIIRKVYRESTANRFVASFTRFIGRHIDRPELHTLVDESFECFVQRNLMQYPTGVEVSALGGVACGFEPILREVLQRNGFAVGTIVATPDEGLRRFHTLPTEK